jgi:hypothetical protein
MTAQPHPNAGPGELYVELSPGSPTFPAIVEEQRTDGWARPHFRRAVAESVLAWLNGEHERGETRFGTGHFDDASIVLVDLDDSRSRIPVDAHGRVALGAGTWPWFISAPAGDPDADAALLADAQRLTPQARENLVTISICGDDPLFPATVDEERWNGWASPHFRRPVAEAVVAWVSEMYRESPDGSERAYWDGDTVVIVSPSYIAEDGYTPTRIEPDADDRYCIGGWEWTWENVEAPTDPPTQ